MMSQLGNIRNSYGKPFIVAVANADVNTVMNATGLPKNAMIISSPYNKSNGEDIGTPALVITDSEGTPIILTKTIVPVNGLRAIGDVMRLDIDNNSIKVNENGALYIDLSDVFASIGFGRDNDGKLTIVTNDLQKASASKFGVVKLDGRTIKLQNGAIYVDTAAIDVAVIGIPGIVKGDNKTIKVVRGIPKVQTESLDKCSSSSFGVLRPDNATIVANDGILSIREQSMIDDTKRGLVKPDNMTITATNGTLSVNTQEFPKASTTQFGVVKTSSNIVSNNGVVSVKDYDIASGKITSMQSRITAATEAIDSLEETIASI